MELTIAYASLCVATALFGRGCRIGFWGVLLSSAFLSPVVVFYGLLGLRAAKVKPNTVESKKEITPAKRWWKLK